jgi:hypothetical protein
MASFPNLICGTRLKSCIIYRRQRDELARKISAAGVEVGRKKLNVGAPNNIFAAKTT